MVEMMTNRELVGPYNWPGSQPEASELEQRLRHRLGQDGLIARESGRLVVELVDGTAAGDVTWRSERWGPSPKSRCLAFGIALLPQYRGHGYGTEAQRLLIDFLFGLDEDLNRIQSDTAVDNIPERRSLVKIGMVEEGRVREAEFRDGSYHDHIVYGILRSEWQTQARTIG
jgi:RimJ/RimL family protein N-acetyltransferase